MKYVLLELNGAIPGRKAAATGSLEDCIAAAQEKERRALRWFGHEDGDLPCGEGVWFAPEPSARVSEPLDPGGRLRYLIVPEEYHQQRARRARIIRGAEPDGAPF